VQHLDGIGRDRGGRAHAQFMTTYSELIPVPSEHPAHVPDPLRLAVAAYLTRFKGSSRDHTDSDLRCYLTWCAGHGLDPLAA
jgi:integrase/recombinase XerD